jgi:hypothetical protein
LPFRSKERLGGLTRSRHPLAIITANVVLLFLAVEQESPRTGSATRDIEMEFVNFGKLSLTDVSATSMSRPDRNVSEFSNLEMSVRWGRAAGGCGAPA